MKIIFNNTSNNNNPNNNTPNNNTPNNNTPNNNTPNNISLSNAQLDLIKNMRAAWGDHIWLLRSYLISNVHDLDDLEYITEKFYQDAEYHEIFDRIYGIEKTEGMEEIIKDHITLEIQLINELKMGNETAVDMTRVKRYQQADDMAGFLSELNPYLNKNELQSLINTHVDLTEEQIRLYVDGKYDSKNYADELALLDEVKAQGFEIADYISAGIITQFDF